MKTKLNEMIEYNLTELIQKTMKSKNELKIISDSFLRFSKNIYNNFMNFQKIRMGGHIP